MRDADTLRALRHEMHDELTRHILPYWMRHAPDEAHGGFVGRITQEGEVVADAPKGAILNARILWSFSAAYRALGDPACLRLADRAFDYLRERFLDPDHDGVYWSLDACGRPLDDRKHLYAQAFALYAAVEHHRATGRTDSRELALRLHRLVETHGADAEHGGYAEAFARDWTPMDDARLSDRDLDAPKSMNTHLHLLEAYSNLYRVWPDPTLRDRQKALVERFLDHIADPATGHFRLFFGRDWTPSDSGCSFGHDIEAAWLLLEAADLLGDPALRARVRDAAVRTARVTRAEGQDADGGLFNERDGRGRLDTDKHWWPQAEAVVGFLAAYGETGERDFLEAAAAAWDFIRRRIVDRARGEWFWRVDREGTPYPGEDKVGFWKCPYHNGRACLEVLERTGGSPLRER